MEFEYELGEVESAILNLAEELAEITQKIEYEALFYKAVRELTYSKIEISNALNKLYLKKFIRVGSRLTKSRVLENLGRKKIYDYTSSHPGAHLRELADRLSITPNLLYWHLNMLENFEYIYRVKFLNYVNFFPSSFSKNHVFPFLVLKNKNALRIFTKILKNPLIDFETLRDGLSIQKSVISYHLENLFKFNLVFEQKFSEKVLYGINHDETAAIKIFYNLSDEILQNSIEIQASKIEKLNIEQNKFDKSGQDEKNIEDKKNKAK